MPRHSLRFTTECYTDGFMSNITQCLSRLNARIWGDYNYTTLYSTLHYICNWTLFLNNLIFCFCFSFGSIFVLLILMQIKKKKKKSNKNKMNNNKINRV